MIDWAELTLFLYITARMSGFVLFNPILGRQTVPGSFRSGLVLVLSVFVFSGVRQAVAVPGTLMELSVRLLLELAAGLFLGMVVNFFLYIPQMAGEIIDTQMGMTMNQIYDPASQANMSPSGVLLNAFMMLLFFVGNGHHTLLRLLITSGEVAAFGEIALTLQAVDAMLELFIQCTLLAVKLSLPILLAELLGQLGMGVLMKVIPQINIFVINIDLKVLLGLGLLYILIVPFSEYLLQAEVAMLNSLGQILEMLG